MASHRLCLPTWHIPFPSKRFVAPQLESIVFSSRFPGKPRKILSSIRAMGSSVLPRKPTASKISQCKTITVNQFGACVMTTNQEDGRTEQAPTKVVTSDEVAENDEEIPLNDENCTKGQVLNDPHGKECQKVVVRRSNRARKKSLKVRENEGI